MNLIVSHAIAFGIGFVIGGVIIHLSARRAIKEYFRETSKCEKNE